MPGPTPGAPKLADSVASRPPRGRSRCRRPSHTPRRGGRRARQPRIPRQTAAVNQPRAFIILVGTAAAVIVAAGIGAAAWLIGPAFLAWVIVVVIAPVARRLRDRRAPRLGRHRRAGGAGLRRRGGDGGRRGGLRGPPGHGAPAVRRGGRRAPPRARHAARDLRHRAGPGAGGRRRPGHRQGRGLRRRCCSRASPGWRPTWSSCCRSCCSSASRRAAPTPGWP